jgi:purine-binding chemotaxis protein CheW
MVGVEDPNSGAVLLVRVPGAICAFALDAVVEIMRPLPVRTLAGMPAFVRGLALVRGAPTPVIDLSTLFLGSELTGTRFVILKTGGRTAAVIVNEVLGVVQIDRSTFQEMPPVLQSARSELVEEIGTLDSQLLVTLRTARLVPDTVWEAISNTAKE